MIAVSDRPVNACPVSNRPDVLRFETATLESPVEITGRVATELAVSTDVEDTDCVRGCIVGSATPHWLHSTAGLASC